MIRTLFATTWIVAAITAFPAATGAQIDPGEIREAVEAVRHEAVERFGELLRFPNDAHDPAAMLPLLEWWERELEERGFTTRRLETPGMPLLLAERAFPAARRAPLVYPPEDPPISERTRRFAFDRQCLFIEGLFACRELGCPSEAHSTRNSFTSPSWAYPSEIHT